ncbi:helix-turn-helix domain-containing protein [Rhodobacteraceae bacterium KMM 6894]|nr:helix-turn-helix domain-containing protein [Rhodobacteraceae bacterium KMM 6894]
MSSTLLTINDIRQRLNCATSTIYRWMEVGEFPKQIKIGGMARWTEKDISDFLERAVKRRNDAGPRPKAMRRGRKAHFPIQSNKKPT